jgi:hypothetical protein
MVSKQRLARLEAMAADARRAYMASLPLEELQALAAGCPAEVTALIEKMSDVELGQVLGLPDGELGAFMVRRKGRSGTSRERTRDTPGSSIGRNARGSGSQEA